ncbi:MAG: GNAT family N-acetyltransferase [Clostridiales bacterium]|nr:GNAT family N-acetyltransferase [Clostridiales bacterium]
MKKVDIREMTAKDWNGVARVYQQGIDSNACTFVTVCPTYEAWDASHIDSCRFVAEIEGEIAGFVCLSPTSVRASFSGVVEVSIYIDQAFQNMGIGTLLMQNLIKASEEQGFWTIYSSIFIDNHGSRKLHEKSGFRQIGVREKIAKDSLGNWRDTVIYERRSEVVI